MFLKKLTLNNFKNYKLTDFDFSDKINCFVGNNGAGKTNILDAIYYLSFCKSAFNQVDSQNINHEADYFAVHGHYTNQEDVTDRISCVQKRNAKKVFKMNKKDYERLADHIGKVPLVLVSPYDRDLINDGSDARRKYIDGVISQFNHLYLSNLIDYNKVLLQRNTLLKQFAEQRYCDEVSLFIWNDKLSDLGKILHEERLKFLVAFNPLFEKYYQFLSGSAESVEIEYQSQLAEAELSELLLGNLKKDLAVRYTTTGIHKDDLVFKINGYPIKKYGSQGQQKSFVIAIKLAQFEYTRLQKKFKPILLFDDIFDKLDDKRVHQIIELVSENNFGQVFITDTQQQRIEKIFKAVDIDHKIFTIKQGEAELLAL